MTAALMLAAYALLMATGGSWLLGRSRWPHRSPRLAVATWQAASFSVPWAIGLAGVVLLLPQSPVSAAVARIAHACAPALDAVYRVPGGTLAGMLVGALLLGAVVRAVLLLAHDLWMAMGDRARQRQMLALVSRVDPTLDALVVDHEAVAAYCVPGRGGRVVFTTAALAALGDKERLAVLAHEQAHLRQRHHLVLAAARALRRAFPRLPLMRTAEMEIAVLVEMVADDVSVRRSDVRSVASALRVLSSSVAAPGRTEVHPSAVHASALVRRLQRLVTPARPLTAVVLAARSLVVAAALTLPLVLAAAPATATLQSEVCPVPARAPATETDVSMG